MTAPATRAEATLGDIEAAYDAWSARGAQFLAPPKQHPYETRCYIRDPDGYLIEVGQTTDPIPTTPGRWRLPNRLVHDEEGRPRGRMAAGAPL
jgi:hypothetical protein